MTAGSQWACEYCGCVSAKKDQNDNKYYCDQCATQAYCPDTERDDEDIYSNMHKRKIRAPEPTSQIRRPRELEFESFEDPGDNFTHPEGGDTLGPTGPTDFGSQSRKLESKDYYSEIRLRYVMGFQIMVQLQCKALVEKFNVSPLIVGIVGPIWLRLLASTGIMADGWADEALLESESQVQGEAVDSKPSFKYRNEPHNMFGKRLVLVWHKSLNSSIPLSYSLAISFLVCHLARENVLPTDIVRWAIEGKLPFFYAFLEIENQLGSPSSACPLSSSRLFRPVQVITAQKLEAMAGSIAKKIGLQLPPVNFHGLSSRFLNQLGLPLEEILPQACRIYEWSMPPGLYLSANKLRTPTRVWVMAILIVTIRKMFDLNGHGKWESLSGSGNSSFGVNEKEADLMSDADTHDSGDEGTKLDDIRLLKILEKKYNELKDSYDFSKDLASYLQYCKDVVFAGSGSTQKITIEYDEEKLIEEFWSFYQNHQEDNEPHPSGIGGDSKPKRQKTSKDESKSSLKSIEDERLRLLKQDMEDHKFCYLAPRKQYLKSYIFYARIGGEGAFIYNAHADYYILLRVCAKLLQYEIRGLHCVVMAFERRLGNLEKRIDCCLHDNAITDAEDDECTDFS